MDWDPIVFRKKFDSPKDHAPPQAQVDPALALMRRVEREESSLQHLNKAFGQRVMQTRLRHGFSKQSDLAIRIGERPDVINRIERGLLHPKLQSVLTKINRALKLAGDDLLRMPAQK